MKKSHKEWRKVHYRETKIRITLNFSSKTLQANKLFQVLKGEGKEIQS